jgi:two-component system, LytTR family, sensor histidine kinase AgrC
MLESLYWDILEYSANLVEAAMMVILLQQFFETKYKKKWVYVLAVLGVFIVISAMNYFNNNASSGIKNFTVYFNVIIYIGIGIFCAFLLFQGSNASRIILPVLMMVLITMSEMIMIGILKLTFNISDDQITGKTPYRMLGIIVSKVALIALVFFASRFSKKHSYSIPPIYSLSLLFVPVISIISMITIMQYMLSHVESVLSPIWFILSAIGLLLVNILIIYLFEALMNYSRSQSQFQLMSQQAEMLGNHLRETNALQEETHRIWHDMKNHFTVIQWMVKSKSYDKLDQYMQTLNETVANSMPAVQCGNPILDALLNPKAAEAKKSGIELTVNACIPSRLSIEDIDLNILFSNALDNAFEACRKLPEGSRRFINVDAYLRNDHLVLMMKNTFNGELNMLDNELKTTKKEAGMHGIGMGNMKKTVQKYDGHIVTKIEGNVFILSAILYCSILTENAG